MVILFLELSSDIPSTPPILLHGVVKIKVKLSLCFLTEHHAMKTYWGAEV
jgi:hypothetical protein